MGQPFLASEDLYMATLDSICSVAFGLEKSKRSVTAELDHLQSLPKPTNTSGHLTDGSEPIAFSGHH